MSLFDYCNDMGYDTNDFHSETPYNSYTYSTHLTYIPFQLTVTGHGLNKMTSHYYASVSMLEALKLYKSKNEDRCQKTRVKEYLDTLVGCGDKLIYSTKDISEGPKFRCTLSHPSFQKFIITEDGESKKSAENKAAQSLRTSIEFNVDVSGLQVLLMKN